MKGMYMALSGAVASERKLDVITNNLANVNSMGFKEDRTAFKGILASYYDPKTGMIQKSKSSANNLAQYAALSKTYTSMNQGNLLQTGSKLDFSIEGDGFFKLQAEDGSVKLTRNGNFQISKDGALISENGMKVLGKSGQIDVSGGEISVSPDGTIAVNGVASNSFDIVSPKNKELLIKESDTTFSAKETETPANFRVRQGYVEASNVNSVKSMVSLIEVSRNFGIYTKTIQAFDEMTQKLISEFGRP